MYLSIKLRNINITNNLENNPNNFACKQWFYAKKIGIYLFIQCKCTRHTCIRFNFGRKSFLVHLNKVLPILT